MPAASEVSALPAVETNWPVHINVNDRLRKTEKGEMGRELAATVMEASWMVWENWGQRRGQFAHMLSIFDGIYPNYMRSLGRHKMRRLGRKNSARIVVRAEASILTLRGACACLGGGWAFFFSCGGASS